MTRSGDTSDSESRSGHVVDILREAYLKSLSGVLSLLDGEKEELFLRRGELFVDRDGELSRDMGEAIRAAASSPRPASLPEVSTALRGLADRIYGGRRQPRSVEWKTEIRGVELAGPLPTVLLLLETSVLGGSEGLLIERLGGEDAVLARQDDTPALAELPGLDPEMAQSMVQVERPVKVSELLRSGDRLATLRGLVRLWAVGLISSRGLEAAERKSIVATKTLDRFLERIGEALDDEPLGTSVEIHRTEMASLLEGVGNLDHYALLGVERQSLDESAISGAYDRLARKVHPRHAARLGLAGKEGMLELLFDKATDAYLTLSDPVRRSEYNNLMGLHNKVEVDRQQRDEEKRVIARQNYLRGASCLAEMDYSTAVDLLKEAARLDPKPEYFSTLGKAQAKNPRWRKHAAQSFRQALELEPNHAGYHLALGKVLEGQEEIVEAKECYAKALELMPDNVDAQLALDKLTSGSGSEPRKAGLRGVLGRRRN